MEVELAYGKNKIKVVLPKRAVPTIIRKPRAEIMDNKEEMITQAMLNPIGNSGFRELGGRHHSACILICDITRPVPNKLFLKPLIENLVSCGVEFENILILVATGLHRANVGAELNELIGDPWVLKHIKIENHDALDDSAHVDLGKTSVRQVPVLLDRRFVNADIKIVTGLVEPHFMAGYSGGRKVVAPGICHQKTIRTFHSSRFMDNPNSKPCNLDGNPLHEEQIEIIKMLKCEIFGVNVVLDEYRNLTYVSFGDLIKSHLAAVEVARRNCEVPVSRKYNIVLTSAAGYPLDKTYYQTIKGMVTPLDIIENDGTLIVVSECSEGFGSENFRKSQERLILDGVKSFSNSLKAKELADIDEWQTEMQLKPMRIAKIKLFSPKLSKEDKLLTGIDIIDDIAFVLEESITKYNDPNIAVIPEGPYLIPFVS